MARQPVANEMAAIQAAIMVLGHCFVQPTKQGTYVLHGIDGAIHIVGVEDGGIVCRSCTSLADEHTSIVLLFRLRWEATPVSQPRRS